MRHYRSQLEKTRTKQTTKSGETQRGPKILKQNLRVLRLEYWEVPPHEMRELVRTANIATTHNSLLFYCALQAISDKCVTESDSISF